MIMKIAAIAGLIALGAACAPESGSGDTESATENTQASEGFLRVEDGRLLTTHNLQYAIRANENFSIAGPKFRQDTFDGVPFDISLAAFISSGAAVMVHAERVSDGSGASNYDNMPLVDWPDGTFRSPGIVCVPLTLEDTEGEHDLEWLMAEGFDLVGTLQFAQFFASTADYNDEIVISILARVPDCEEEASGEALIAAVQSQFTVEAISN